MILFCMINWKSCSEPLIKDIILECFLEKTSFLISIVTLSKKWPKVYITPKVHISSTLLNRICWVKLMRRFWLSSLLWTMVRYNSEKKKDCTNRLVVTTPTEIVRYMVEKTMQLVCADKTPQEIKNLGLLRTRPTLIIYSSGFFRRWVGASVRIILNLCILKRFFIFYDSLLRKKYGTFRIDFYCRLNKKRYFGYFDRIDFYAVAT